MNCRIFCVALVVIVILKGNCNSELSDLCVAVIVTVRVRVRVIVNFAWWGASELRQGRWRESGDGRPDYECGDALDVFACHEPQPCHCQQLLVRS